MTDKKTPVDLAVDLLVYAPLGLALEARNLLPRLVERGRQQVTGQVGMARVVGQFAVQQGQQEASKRLGAARRQAESALGDLGLLGRQEADAAAGTVRGAASTAAGTAATVVDTAGDAADTVAERAGDAADTVAAAAGDTADAVAETAGAVADAAAGNGKGGGAAAGERDPDRSSADGGREPDPDELAIPGYDSLSASQVVPRLAGLAGDELEAVRAYESGKRARKTILNRIAQLQG